MQFETEKHGYNKKEVDKYIINLKVSANKAGEEQRVRIKSLVEENEYIKTKLNAYKNKEEMISKALIDAMSRAKKIEENSRKIYELEIQKLRILYNKYKTLLDNLLESNACLEVVDTVTKYAKNFKQGINKVLSSQNDRANITQNADARIRELLTKMNKVVADRNTEIQNDINQTTTQKNLDVPEVQHHSIIKPICDINLDQSDKFENLVDKFLDSDDEESNAFAKQILNKSKITNCFDLKESVNPTESL